MEAVRNIPHPRSGANVASGLDLLLTEVFRQENGDRPSIPNVAVWLKATNPDRRNDDVSPKMTDVVEAKVHMLLIGVLGELAADGEEEGDMSTVIRVTAMGVPVFLVDQFRDLWSVVKRVANKACLAQGKCSLCMDKTA